MRTISKAAKTVLALAMLATVTVPTSASARCFVKIREGVKRYFEDGDCSQTKLPCVDFKTEPKDGQLPVEMVLNDRGVRVAMIKDTAIACAEVGKLARRGAITSCTIRMGTPREWAALNDRGGGIKEAGW